MNDQSEPTPFWLVWDPKGRSPSHKHMSERTARTEAARLAREHPGHDFYVLEPISVTRKQDVVTQEFEKIPF